MISLLMRKKLIWPIAGMADIASIALEEMITAINRYKV